MRRLGKVLVSAGTTVLLAGAIGATSAQSASAGGWWDFYQKRRCTAKGGALVGEASNYDIRLHTDQRYHHGATNPPGTDYLVGVYYDGRLWPFIPSFETSGMSGTKYDGTTDFRNIATDHTIKFRWKVAGKIYECALPEF